MKKIIHTYIHVYSLELKQIFYDALSVLYYSSKNLNQALFYLEQGLIYAISEKTTAMMLFHKTKILRKIGKLSEALNHIQIARILFDNNQNYYQELQSSIELGRIYSCLHKAKEAEEIFKQCLQVMQTSSSEEVQLVYCYLTLNSLSSEQYTDAISYAKQGITKNDRYRAILNILISYSYWRLEQKAETKKYAMEAERYVQYESITIKKLIFAYIKYISNHVSIEKKEKLFVAILNKAREENDIQLQIIALHFLVGLDFLQESKEKAIDYRDQLIHVLARYR